MGSVEPHPLQTDREVRANAWLSEFARSVTSASGEDGIIEKILEVIGAAEGWCVEFGAWDGKHASNTYNLIADRGYSAVLIEADSGRFRELEQTHRGNGRVRTLQARVGFEREDGLDALLQRTAIPRDFDVVSIDIDGADYHVWAAIELYEPKVVVVEFNPTIPTPVEFVQARRLDVFHGSSLLSLVLLGKEKGYELVAVTGTNAIFVARRFFPRFEIGDNSPQALRTTENVSYIFQGYDGTIFLRGLKKLLWRDLPLEEAQFQRLPRWLRRYPSEYNWLEWRLYAMYNRLYKLRYARSRGKPKSGTSSRD